MDSKLIKLEAMTISVNERSSDFIAYLISNPGIWGLGINKEEAIGDLIITVDSFSKKDK